jgi:hypothetical protein
MDVSPINEIEVGIANGHYGGLSHSVISRTVLLKPADEIKKTVYILCFERTIDNAELTDLLHDEGKKLCKNGPNYLLGLMMQVREEHMPRELSNMDIVAVEYDDAPVFMDQKDHPCFLYVYRRGFLRMPKVVECDGGKWDDRWAFLVEDLEPQAP